MCPAIAQDPIPPDASDMREFYLLYRDDERVQPLVAQIGWTHNLVIFQRCKTPLEREFYIRMTHKMG
jgi:predicted nuclease of restriction endonuclease-like (RecB) superfamily